MFLLLYRHDRDFDDFPTIFDQRFSKNTEQVQNGDIMARFDQEHNPCDLRHTPARG